MKLTQKCRTVKISDAKARERAMELVGAGWRVVGTGLVTMTLEREREGLTHVQGA